MEEIDKSISHFLQKTFLEIYIVDVETLEILYANETALSNLGYTLEELLGMTVYDVTLGNYNQETLKDIFVTEDGNVKFLTETVLDNIHLRKDKSTYKVEAHLQFMSYMNSPAYTVFALDISKKKEDVGSLIENVSMGSWDMDYVTGTSNVSDSWLEMIGFSREDLQTDALELFNRIHPDDIDNTKNKISEYKEKGVPYSIEFRMMHKDGHWVWIQSTGTVVTIDPITKEPLRRSGIHIDITERKEGEVKREQFYNFFQISQDIMVITDDEGRVLEVNPATLNILGYTEEDMLREPVPSFLHPEDLSMANLDAIKIIQSGRGEDFLNRWRCKDGSYRWLSWRVSYDTNNKVAYSVARDVTEQRRVTKELEKQESMYRALAEYSEDVIVQYDRQHRHTYVNPAISQFLDFTEKDLLGKTHREIGYPEDLCKLWGDSIEEVFVTGKPQFELFQAEGKNGHVHIDWRVFPELSPDGSVAAVFSVSRDISEFIKLEDEQQKTQQLSSLGVLAGGIAHDFNNILTILFGNISLAKSQIPKGNASLSTLEKAEKAFYRATYLTSQLLTFAKGGDPVKQDVSIASLVEEISQFDLSGSNVKLVFEPADELWMAKVDKGQMAQVFSNLTINADQAMPDGGHLYISVENAELKNDEVRPLQAGRYLKFTVQDEGIGIGARHLKRIFDPYYSTKHTGSGLGLATVYSIMSKHGGHISVSSTLGKGTCFTLYLPASIVAEPAEPMEAQQLSSDINKAARILIMDDDEMIRNLAIEMLKRNDYTAEGTEDGQQAIDAYRQSMVEGNKFDCVIMDLTIPGGMGGAEAVQEILKLDPEAKVIVSSGYAVDPIMANFANYGFKEVISKPFTIHTLHEKVGKALGVL